MTDLAAWVGKTEHRTDLITAAPIKLLAATIGDRIPQAEPGEPIPPMWHWLFFLPNALRSQLGDDGHPERGGFFPPVPLRRRMFAGGTTRFVAPIAIGDQVERSAEIISTETKEGHGGPLVFVRVRYDLSTPIGPALQEEQTIVFTDADPVDKAQGELNLPEARWQRRVATDPTLLFRFSALTFNAHRIHYDEPYTTAVEGYPRLVVHGPLVALLLLDLATSNGIEDVTEFSFRARSPFYVGDDLALKGDPVAPGAELAAYSSDGRLGMTATVTA